MDHSANTDFLADITGALDWWREAGVDCDFLDEPRSWLAKPEAETEKGAAPARRTAPASPTPVEAPSRLDPASLPQDLATFSSWWLTEPLLDGGGTAGRVAPHGTIGARLMVVVEEPEADDRDVLLSGPQGRLLDAMLAAFGLGRDEIYLASALPRHTPAPNWEDAARRGLGDVLARHVALAAPERLFVLGGHILPLLGHELPQRAAVLRQFNQEERSIPMLASRGLLTLMRQPRAKAILWGNWLDWTAA